MTIKPLAAAWLALMALSIVTVLVTTDGASLGPALFGGSMLLLAWAKARIILSRYLGLWQAPAWLAGFSRVLGFFCLLLLALYVAPDLIR